MFAGRYVWWMLTGSIGFLLALFGIDMVTGVIRFSAGCRAGDGGCHHVAVWLTTGVKPLLVAMAGMVVLGAMMVRLVWLRFLPLWLLPVLVWGLSVAAALRSYGPLWYVEADFGVLLGLLPPATYALLALALFLCFPLEDEDATSQRAAPIGPLAGFAAAALTVYVVVTASSLPLVLVTLFHLPMLAEALARIQIFAAIFLLVDAGNPVPGLVMVVVFALALALRIVRHEQLTARA
jgi:hypothetical protein